VRDPALASFSSLTCPLLSLLVALLALAARPAAALPAWHLIVDTPAGGMVITRLAPPRVTMPGLGEGEVNIKAGKITQPEQNGPILATGGVTITQGPARLTAEKATANPDTGDVEAEGSVVFTEPGRTVRGERLTYNTDTRQVHAETAETVVNGVIVRARDINANELRYTITDASITTCDRPRPHYRLTARTVTVTPNDRIVARHVGVWFFGLRLFVVPSVSMMIGGARGEGGNSPLPRLGSNSRDGFFIGKVLPLIDDPHLYVDFDGLLSVRRGLTGGFDAAAPAGPALQLIGAVKYGEIAPNQRTQFLEVDRLPEVGVLWVSPPPSPRARRRRSPRARTGRITTPIASPNEGAAVPPPEPGFRPLRAVGEDVEHQPGLLRPPEAGRWFLRAQATVGYLHQREGGATVGEAASLSHGRLDLRATAARSGLRIAGLSLPVLQLFARHSLYDDGHSYNVFGVGARQEWRIGDHWSTGLRAFLHQTSGQSAFLFDQVEIRNELQPALSYTAGGTTLGWVGRMDVDRSQLFDQEYSIARVFDCLEPRLSYHTRRRQINLEVRIVGLEFE
jgi:lipopolysaccharide export system protein LptA